MPATHTKLLYHVVFSTKHRRPLITDELAIQLYPYLGGIIRSERGSLLEIGGMADHLHVLARFRADITVSRMLQMIKGSSSKWIHETFPELHAFEWQEGYGAFTASAHDVQDLREYIQQQKDHHRVKTFQEEYVELLNDHGVEYDERYLWD